MDDSLCSKRRIRRRRKTARSGRNTCGIDSRELRMRLRTVDAPSDFVGIVTDDSEKSLCPTTHH